MRRPRGLFTVLRRPSEAGLDTEIDTHLALLAADYIRAGLSDAEAQAAARRDFGGVPQLKEAYRDARRWAFLSHLLRDLRHGLRGLRRNPGFTLAAIVTLALGVAANATIFSLVNAVLLRPLPVRNAARLTVFGWQQRDGMTTTTFSPQEVETLRAQASSWSSIVAVTPMPYELVADRRADRVVVSFVSDNYWDALGLTPAAGSFFRETNAPTDASPPAIILSYSYWRSRFGGDRRVIGTLVKVAGVQLTIVGVAPREFHGDSVFLDPKGFVPLHAPGFATVASQPARVLGVLPSTATLTAANRSLGAISETMVRNRQQQPDEIYVRAYWERLTRPVPHLAVAEILMASFFGVLATLVLVLACVNVAGLIAIRTASRRAEIAVRAALGASRARLACHLFVETSLLVAAASGLGLLFGQLLTIELGRLLPAPLGRFVSELRLTMDWHLVGFVLAAIVGTALLVGVLPAIRLARPSMDVLRNQTTSVSQGRLRGRRALMSVQIAAALLLLIVAGLFVRSLTNLSSESFGFDRRDVFDFSLDPSEAGYDGATGQQILQRIRDQVATVPGIESAALAQGVPMTPHNSADVVHVDGAVSSSGLAAEVSYMAVSPAYFDTVRIPLPRGRTFSATDAAETSDVAIINQAMAARYWPQQDAVGRTFLLGHSATPVHVIGVVGNILNYLQQDVVVPYFYVPLAQHPRPRVTLQVRSQRPPPEVFQDVTAAIRAAAPDVAPYNVQTMSETIDGAIDGLLLPRLASWLAASFGGLGLLLALVGVYSVVAYGASQRRREMALRVALGATPRDIRREVLKSGLTVVVTGLGAGTLVAAGLAIVTANLYFGVRPLDPATFAAAVIAVGTAALAACYVPARRATRVNPIVALKDL